MLNSAPPFIKAFAEVASSGNKGSSLGQFLDAVEQKELLMQGDPVDPEKIKVEQLIGNEKSETKGSAEEQLRKLAIPTRHLPGGYIQYKIRDRWWAPPQWTKQSGNYLDPLPYTGGYDELGNRWVNHEGKKTTLERLAFPGKIS
ncbi:Protein PR73 [Cricetulus griseus]|uniref:Protein PR73 n=1 Tax=Cricetulus griseus TaxID=10029 RepID=G3HM08_CRIGR|nr:Protein PR73 [Cricetulus griseus]